MANTSVHQDPITSDPSPIDWAYPPTAVPVAIRSHGKHLNGIVYVAQGPGPHPTVLLLHGYPGHEKNLDLAQAIRRAGWNVLFFHYRGTWGSEGSLSIDHALEDVTAALDLLHLPDAQQAYRVDPERLALVGHSFGAYLAIMAGARRADVDRIAFLASANFGLWGRAAARDPALAAAFAAHLDDMGRGSVRSTSWQDMFTRMGDDPDACDLVARVPDLDGKDLLLIGAARDEELPLAEHYQPLLDCLQQRNRARVTSAILDTDHCFSGVRIALARQVVAWLNHPTP